MRRLPIFLFASLLLSTAVESQNLPPAPQPAPEVLGGYSWNSLRYLEGDTSVFVSSSRGTTRCESLTITETALSCEAYVVFGSSRTTTIPRPDVKRVRERSGELARWVVVAVAVAGGSYWGQTSSNQAQRGLDAGVVGLFFGAASYPLSPLVTHLIPGRTLYKRPDSSPDPISR
jgi:hypothetical protein